MQQNIDIISLLLRRKRTVGLFSLSGLAVAIAYGLLSPSWYEARLAVVPTEHGTDSAAMLLAAKIPGLDMKSTGSRRIEAVLTSTSVTDEVIDKFHLDARYGAGTREQAREEVWAHCSADVDRKSDVVSLTCEDKDPELAMAMAGYFGEVGNRVFGRISTGSAHEEAQFLESQVAKARHDVDESSRKLREFQELHKIIDLPEQSKAVISAMATLKGDLLSKQLELSYLNGFSAPGEARVVQLQQQIEIIDSKLDQLEDVVPSGGSAHSVAGTRQGSGSAAPNGQDFFPVALAVPDLRFQLEQLMREQKIEETVYSLLTQRFELAKAESARETSTFQILDQPTKPMRRSRPKRRKLALLGLFGGLAAATAWLVGPVWWRSRTGTIASS